MKHTTRSASFAVLATVTAVALAACGAPGTADTGAGGGSNQSLTAPAEKSGTLTMVTKFADPKYAPYFESVAKAYETGQPQGHHQARAGRRPALQGQDPGALGVQAAARHLLLVGR